MSSLVHYYDTLFKRKSFHLFRGVGDDRLTKEELAGIETAYRGFECLYPGIRTAIRIIPASRVMLKRDAEYCILLYSEKKENYLLNAGYVGEQLDLYLTAQGIGSLWYGIGKPDEETFEGLDFVIMFAVRRVRDETKFRKDMFKAKRKPLAEIWEGDDPGVANVARFAPSACNSQPWRVQSENGTLTVYRSHKPGRSGMMSAASACYFNRIDVGIFLCFLEICLQKEGIRYERALFPDDGADRACTKSAEYTLLKDRTVEHTAPHCFE